MSIYSNVGLYLLSQDAQGEVWIHFAVEYRNTLKGSVPVLSSFGGAIDTVGTKKEHPIQAVLRKLHEEALGHMDAYVTQERLSDPNKTYSYSYTDPTNQASNLLFATTIEHPEGLAAFHQAFLQERDDRLHHKNGKKFNTDSETEVKALRSVRLSDLKQHWADVDIDPDAKLVCSDQAGVFLSIDSDSKQYSTDKQLIDYKVLETNGEAVTTPIPKDLNLEQEIASSLRKIMPMLEYRLFKKPLEGPFLMDGFFGKSIRADEYSFIDDFVDTLPVKDLISTKRSNESIAEDEQTTRRSEVRRGRRQPLTARGTAIYDRQLKSEEGIGKPYVKAEKEQFSNYTSLSYYSVADGSPVFGWSKERSNRLLGIISPDILPNRLYVYDGGTIRRPYDGQTRESLLAYIKERTSDRNDFFDENEMPSFIKRVKEVKDSNYNEVMAALRWNIERSAVCVFSDNIESRWVAINWSKKIERKIHAVSDKAFKKGLISAEEHEKFQSYKASIHFYDSINRKTGIYAELSLQEDCEKGMAVFDNPTERQNQLESNNFEFLLLLEDTVRITTVIQDHALMKKLLEERLFIAEDLIDKYQRLTGKPYVIEKPSELKCKNITRSFLQKIATGAIDGFPRDELGRIIFSGFTIQDKDLSGMDLSQFNFHGTTFNNVILRQVKLNVQATDHLILNTCDLSDTPTHLLNLSATDIVGDLICNDEEPNPQLLEKMGIGNFVKNYSLKTILTLIAKQQPTIPLYLSKIALQLIADEQDHDAFNTLVARLKADNQVTVEVAGLIMSGAAIFGKTDLMNELFEQFPDLDCNIKNKTGVTPLMWAIESGKQEVAERLLRQLSTEAINARDSKGKSALTYAVLKNNVTIARLLLEKGASTTPLSAEKKNLYQYALDAPAMLNLLLDFNAGGASFVIANSDQVDHSLLTIAIKAGNIDAVKLIVAAAPNAANYKKAIYGLSPPQQVPALFYAILLDQTEIAMEIVKANPKCLEFTLPDHVECAGFNALHYSFYHGFPEYTFFKALIKELPKSYLTQVTNHANYKGLNALGLAAKHEALEAIKAIVELNPEALETPMGPGYFVGETILIILLDQMNPGSDDIISYLLKQHPQVLNFPIQSPSKHAGHLPLTYLLTVDRFDQANKLLAEAPESVAYESKIEGKAHNLLTYAVQTGKTDFALKLITPDTLATIFKTGSTVVKMQLAVASLVDDSVGQRLREDPSIVAFIQSQPSIDVHSLTQPIPELNEKKQYPLLLASGRLLSAKEYSAALKLLVNTDFNDKVAKHLFVSIIQNIPIEHLQAIFVDCASKKELTHWARAILENRPECAMAQDSEKRPVLLRALASDNPGLAKVIIDAFPESEMQEIIKTHTFNELINHILHPSIRFTSDRQFLLLTILTKYPKEFFEQPLKGQEKGHNALTLLISRSETVSYMDREMLYHCIIALAKNAPSLVSFNCATDDVISNGKTPYALALGTYQKELVFEFIDNMPEALACEVTDPKYDRGIDGFVLSLIKGGNYSAKIVALKPDIFSSLISNNSPNYGGLPVLTFCIDSIGVQDRLIELLQANLAAVRSPKTLLYTIENGPFKGHNALSMVLRAGFSAKNRAVLKLLIGDDYRLLLTPLKLNDKTDSPLSLALKANHWELLKDYPQLIKEVMQSDDTSIKERLACIVLDPYNPLQDELIEAEPSLEAFADNLVRSNPGHYMIHFLDEQRPELAHLIAEQNPQAIVDLVVAGPNRYRTPYYMATVYNSKKTLECFDQLLSTNQINNTFDKKCAQINQFLAQLPEADNLHDAVFQLVLRHIKYQELIQSSHPEAQRLKTHVELALKNLHPQDREGNFIYSLGFSFMHDWALALAQNTPTLGSSVSKRRGMNGLAYSIERGADTVAIYLIETNPKSTNDIITIKDHQGLSPLMLAIKLGKAEIVKAIILKCPASLAFVVQDNAELNGLNPLTFAEAKYPHMVEVIAKAKEALAAKQQNATQFLASRSKTLLEIADRQNQPPPGPSVGPTKN